MYIENNPLRFVRIDDFRDEDVEKMKNSNYEYSEVTEFWVGKHYFDFNNALKIEFFFPARD